MVPFSPPLPSFLKICSLPNSSVISMEQIGDPQEARAIYNANRTDPLAIGRLKSNVGHSEGANECIPANLNMSRIKPKIAEMCPQLEPVSKSMAYTPG